jgi:hypothetical protein
MNTKEYFYFIIPTYFRLTSFIVVGSPHGILTPHLLHSFPLSTNHHQTAHHHHTWHTKRTKKLKKKKGEEYLVLFKGPLKLRTMTLFFQCNHGT